MEQQNNQPKVKSGMKKRMLTAALALCCLAVLATGTLAGLSLKGRFARRLAAVGCSFLAAGLAVPLVTQYLDELDQTPSAPESLNEN